MSFRSPGRALCRGALLLLLAACADDAPQGPGAGAGDPIASPSFALGLYGAERGGRPCRRPEYRQFDFWQGAWEVQLSDGSPAGTNQISSELDGCALLESYAATGYVGRSLNSYDAATGRWHQHWSDNQTTVLDIFGGSPQAGTMILSGVRPTPAGNNTVDRITWTAHNPDLVQQLWEVSSDGGVTFPSVQFDGRYHRRTSVTPDPEIPTGFCSDPAFPALYQFDFTLGSWNVDLTGPRRSDDDDDDDAELSKLRSTVSKDVSDCLIEERLTGRNGYQAIVFTTVRRRLGTWVKTLVDNEGTNVFLTGRQVDGQMVLTGTVPAGREKSKDVRVTWTEQSPDRFAQRWETTTDGGATWEPLLVARYSRKS